MLPDDLQKLRAAVRDIQDFPKPGIVFKDITPILESASLFRIAANGFVEACRGAQISKVAGIDARGFIFGAVVAYELGLGFVPIRKKGKLPFRTKSESYSLEYGEATVEIHEDSVEAGERVVIIDDLLATGGTALAASKLLAQMGAEIVETQFLIELEFLNGRENLTTPVRAFLKF